MESKEIQDELFDRMIRVGWVSQVWQRQHSDGGTTANVIWSKEGQVVMTQIDTFFRLLEGDRGPLSPRQLDLLRLYALSARLQGPKSS